MKASKLLTALALCASMALGGCGIMQPKPAEIPVSKQLSAPAQQVQNVINEATLLALAMVDDIVSKMNRDVITPKEAALKLIKVKEHRDAIAKAQTALDLGDIAKAENQAKAVELLLNLLENELAESERKAKP